MLREEIDEFLSEETDVKNRIENIAKKYKVTDFVKATKPVNEYFKSKVLEKDSQIYGYLYNEREDYFVLQDVKV